MQEAPGDPKRKREKKKDKKKKERKKGKKEAKRKRRKLETPDSPFRLAESLNSRAYPDIMLHELLNFLHAPSVFCKSYKIHPRQNSAASFPNAGRERTRERERERER
jgi:hypothetical protein